MEWTTEAPTKTGWYWAYDESGDMEIVGVFRGPEGLDLWSVGIEYELDFSAYTHWLGPIPKPKPPA